MNITGTWTYRSYLNDPALVGNDPAKALAQIFGEGVFVLAADHAGVITGTFDMGGGYFLDMKGEVHARAIPPSITMRGTGRAGTPTAGWIYDYLGYEVPMWPRGVDQKSTIVGSCIRAVPHNGSPAGVTASTIMIRH